jgi:hypothetical protein
MRLLSTIILGTIFSTAVWAQSPFAGTWKQNRAKSQFDPSSGVITIEPFEQGIRYSTAAGPVYAGPLDESERSGLGAQGSDKFKLKKLGDRGYEATQIRNGKVIVRERVEVSSDGKKLTRSFTTYNRKDGSGTTNIFTHTRTAGDPKPFPYIGSWTMDRSLTKFGSDPVPLIISDSSGVLTWSDPVSNTRLTIDAAKGTVTPTGDNLAPDTKQTVKRIDDRTLELTFNRGPITTTSLYAVAPDGKTMTVRSTTVGTDGKPRTSTFLYERQ